MTEYFLTKSDCRRKTIFPGVDIHTATCREMMLSVVDFQPGAIVAEHSHPHEQVGMLVKGRAHFFVGDDDRVLVTGDMYRIPGGVRHSVVALDDGATALDIFHPVREEYL